VPHHYLTIPAAVLPSLLLIWYFYSRDVFPEPRGLLLKTFGLGCLTVLPVLLVGLPVYFLVVMPLAAVSPAAGAVAAAVLTAAIPEEFFKFLVVVRYCSRQPEFDEPMDGVVYGAVASLGFATLENVLYVSGGGLETALARSLTAVPCHAFLGAIMGYYVGQARFHPERRGSLLATGLGLPMLLHALYDAPPDGPAGRGRGPPERPRRAHPRAGRPVVRRVRRHGGLHGRARAAPLPRTTPAAGGAAGHRGRRPGRRTGPVTGEQTGISAIACGGVPPIIGKRRTGRPSGGGCAMHWLDITLLVVLAFGALLGARSGLLWQVARLVTFGVAFYVSIYYHQPVADLLGTYVTGTSPFVIGVLTYIATFLGVYLVLYGFTLLLQRVLKAARLKTLDRLLGAGFGLLKASLLLGIVLMGLAIYSTPQTDAAMADSQLAPVLLQGMRAVTVAVPQNYKDELNASLERIRKEGARRAGQLSDAAARKTVEDEVKRLTTPPDKAAEPSPHR
jgi:uncharacterized membrane protein required for colicin V production